MNKNIYPLFKSRFGKGPFLQDTSLKDLFTYEDLDHISARYANYFQKLGIQKGDRVMVQVEKSAHNLFIYFACLRSGLIYLPLNTAYKSDELSFFIDNAEPRLIICDPASLSFFTQKTFPDTVNKGRHTTVLSLDRNNIGSANESLASFSTEHRIIDCTADDIAVILYTSGTTGRPKGAMISHRNLAANALALHQAWDWQKDDVMLHALPIFHIHGLFVATHLSVLSGSPIIFLDRFDVPAVIEMLPYATVYMGVPTNYSRLLADDNFNASVCSNIRLFTSGSAPLLVQTFHQFEERTGHSIVERYGMTETGMNTSNPLYGKRKPGTVGPPLKDVSVKVVDDKGAVVKANATGDLLIKGENIFKGYWKLEEKSREEFTDDGYFKTGDLARIDDQGYVSIVGRNKDLIISGGLNVYPKEIEMIIDRMDGVLESAVIGIPHGDFGEAVIGVVVRDVGVGDIVLGDNDAERNNGSVTEEEIINQLKTKVANYKVTKQIHFVQELPRNTMGKVQKNLLRQEFTPET